ncbi:hypothetical protein [Marinilabilia rubra]|uniref:Uncharacterized protein n=1 Tax=Marinilabilia rubra TaxID=2162893 RepID=A0A2U2B9F1_9BACT|nr:hypothetical protein [Marinilabilia rubra]PWD99698.1 hypothetical protein DDZ16_09645 [Marinilabilia rubra]
MKYKKLNTNWKAEPNSPRPEIMEEEDGIRLTFDLNSLDFEHIDEGEKGTLEFKDVCKYRLGTTEEEFHKGQFKNSNDQLPLGEFYELKNSKWEKNFPDDEVLINPSVKTKGLRHFILFLKDETFECIAKDFEFSFDHSVANELFGKYPKGYLSHYLGMFVSNFDAPTTNNFKAYTDLYIQMESLKELEGVKGEIKKIKNNNDLPLFLKLANQTGIEGFGMKQLNEMIKVIEGYKGR